MSLPLEFVKNKLLARCESKHKIGILETTQSEVMESIVDILRDARIMSFVRMDSIMYRGRLKSIVYRVYVSDTMYKRAKYAIISADMGGEDMKILP